MAIIDWLQQKWGWILFIIALMIPAMMCTLHEPSQPCIPKLQHSPFKQLACGPVGGASAQVINQEGKQNHVNLEGHMAAKATVTMSKSHSLKYSAHHMHLRPQAVLAL